MTETAWPFHTDDEAIVDFHGTFVGAAVDAQQAKLLAAAPVLYLYFKSTINAIESLPEESRGNFQNMIHGTREAVEEALKGVRI